MVLCTYAEPGRRDRFPAGLAKFRGRCSSTVPTTAHYSTAKKYRTQRRQVPMLDASLTGPALSLRTQTAPNFCRFLQASLNLRTAKVAPVGRRLQARLRHNLSSKHTNSSSTSSRRSSRCTQRFDRFARVFFVIGVTCMPHRRSIGLRCGSIRLRLNSSSSSSSSSSSRCAHMLSFDCWRCPLLCEPCDIAD